MLGVNNLREFAVANHLLIHPHLDLVLKALVLADILSNDNGESRSPTSQSS